MEIQIAAAKFLDNNINVIPFVTTSDPVHRNKFSKKPATKNAKIFHSRKLLKSAIPDAFLNANSIAVVCGSISNNVIVIDIENSNYTAKNIYHDFKHNFKNLIEKYKIPIVKTVSGGYHVYFRVDKKEEELLKHKNLAMYESDSENKLKLLIETRANDNFCNTYPSKGYEIADNSIFEIPLLDSLIAYTFFDFFASYDCRPERNDDREYGVDKNSPEYLFNKDTVNQTKILTLLKAKGWTIESTKYKNGKEFFNLTRPGKTEGVSATFLFPPKNEKQTPGLYIFTSETYPFPRDGFFSLFDCSRYLQFEGDKNEARQVAVNSGYGRIERHVLIDNAVRTYNFKGIKKELTLTDLAQQFPYDEPNFIKSRIEVVYDAYKRDFALGKQDQYTIMEKFLKDDKKIWVNKYGKVLMRGKSTVNIDYYWTLMTRYYGYKGNLGGFISHCKSGGILPIKDKIDLFFRTSTPYNPEFEDDYIQDFAKSVRIEEVLGHRSDLFKEWETAPLTEFQYIMFRKHLIRAIAQFYEKKVNRYIFVLQGKERSKKTEHIRYLASFLDPIYYSEERFKKITVDTLYKACRCFINNIEEFDKINDMGDIKDIISKIYFNDRRSYTPDAVAEPRIATYFATLNPEEFLPIGEENTRFLCFPIKKINGEYHNVFQPGEKNIDPKDIWRQAYYLYKTHVSNSASGYTEHCELNEREILIQKELNNHFTNGTPVIHVVRKTIRRPLENATNHVFGNLSEIISLIRDNDSLLPMFKREELLAKKGIKQALSLLKINQVKKGRYLNFWGEQKQGTYYTFEVINRHTY